MALAPKDIPPASTTRSAQTMLRSCDLRINIWRSCSKTTNVQTNILILNGPQLIPTHNLCNMMEELKGIEPIPQ